LPRKKNIVYFDCVDPVTDVERCIGVPTNGTIQDDHNTTIIAHSLFLRNKEPCQYESEIPQRINEQAITLSHGRGSPRQYTTEKPSRGSCRLPSHHEGQISDRSPVLAPENSSLVSMNISQTWVLGTITRFVTYRRGMTATIDGASTTPSIRSFHGQEKATVV